MHSPMTRPVATTAKWLRCLLLLAIAGHAAAAHASLGGDSASVETDRLQLRATAAVRQTAAPSGSYTVHEILLPSGTRVRQYVSSAGVVFAVGWSGPFMPNLRQLLGPHFEALAARQASGNHAGQRFLSLHDPGLVIESGGHPRSYAGRAYLPGALPAGVTAQEIR